ncbi:MULTISPECIES: FecCD family ABC transporter permease [unclassified Gordonia (in: high G+C Gram-positive bacteria)]|uniref:FecCD family ABC transporter permease n=1 Tax=unclassified Gordonia (in: high G+C Gram-positive bacteria) TaxID=2657482 RepID=UPI00071DBF69|nr:MULTISPECIES: iron ABC transporter permease [unclassified Gordonia (in: high G+C Gram-positive bacteria)]SCB79545.1 iron complex transport system permease protein [Gordonia sp. v-85]
MNPPTSIKTETAEKSGIRAKTRIAPHPGGYRIAIEPMSMVVRPRMLAVALVATAITIVLFLTSVGVSDFPLTPIDVARILLGGGTRVENVVVFDVALPRALVALLVGFGLGLAGSLTQLIAQNPLATPDMLGITAGASVAAVTAIAFSTTSWGAWLGDLGVPAAAMIGGLATAVAMYVLAWPGRKANSGINPFRLVLIGVGMTWLLQALTQFLLSRADIRDVGRAQVWIVGSVANVGWSNVWPVVAGVCASIVVVIVLARQIGMLSLGPDLARGLGVRTGAVSTTLLLTAVLVAALSVSAAGPIAFVALLAPQIALRLAGTAVPTPLVSGVIGSSLVLGGDLLCRTVLPGGLPVGIVTAAIGGPFLIYLMVVMSRKASV